MSTYPKLNFDFTPDDLDLTKARPRLFRREGRVCKHYTVLSLYAVQRRVYIAKNGTIYRSSKPFYKVQCKYNPDHVYLLTADEIDNYPDTVRCACGDTIKRDKVHTKSEKKYAGTTIAGCEVIRRSKNCVDYQIPIFEYQCPYCGKTFERRIDTMKLFELRHPNKNAGCDECMQDRRLKFRSRYTRDDIRTVASNTLRDIISRIHNPLDVHYNEYGGRNISVTAYWDPTLKVYTVEECIDHMVEFMITHGWEPGLELDRINNNGDYSPDNCRWADRETQDNNRRVTMCAQYGNNVYVGTEFLAISDRILSNVWKERSPISIRTALYQREHKDLNVRVYYDTKCKTFRDQDGYIRMVPSLKVFPLYPDDKYPPVHSYSEYLNRLTSNLKEGTPTRFPVSREFGKYAWVTKQDLDSIGIDITQYADVIIYR